MAFIFIPMELFKIHWFFHSGRRRASISFYMQRVKPRLRGLLEAKQGWWVFCWVWSHCVFWSKWCDNGHDVGVDLTTRKERWEECLHRTLLSYPEKKNEKKHHVHLKRRTSTLGEQNCKTCLSKCLHLHKVKMFENKKCAAQDIYVYRRSWLRKMDCQRKEREKEMYFIKSLFWNFKKLHEASFYLWALPNLGPNENFFKCREPYHEKWPETINSL